MSFLLPLGVVLVLAALAAIMASESVRTRLLGRSPFANAMIPLVAGGLAWSATGLVDIVGDEISDNSHPSPTISTFIEDIQFGLPDVPNDYKSRSLTASEIEKLLAPLVESGEQISLTAAEVERLNLIADKSGMAGSVATRAYSLDEVGDLLSPSVSFYYEYQDWEKTAKIWAEALTQSVNSESDKRALLSTFIRTKLERKLDGSGLLRAVVGMAYRQTFSLNPIEGDCLPSPMEGIEYTLRGKNYAVYFGTFGVPLVEEHADAIRRAKAEQLAHLFRMACTRTLSQALANAANTFGVEHPLMTAYVDVWRDILKSRRSNTLRLRVTFSNTGKYDVFVRNEGKIAVGPRDDSTPKITAIGLIKEDGTKDSEGPTSPYFIVKSRTAETKTLTIRMDDELSGRMHGTYVGGLNYLRLGVLVNSGPKERVFLSPIAPFSEDARKQVASQVSSIDISF